VKIYQIATKLPNGNKNVPRGRNIFQTDIEYTHLFPLKDPPKFTQIGIFGLKINHLATLICTFGSSPRREIVKGQKAI
jgi:hypothetical protein